MQTDIIEEITSLAGEEGFSGAVLIAEHGETVFEQAFGYADIANKRENNADTKFGIASGTKFFTALSIGKLIEAGDLSLSDNAFGLAGCDFPKYSKDITVGHLLTHTSGIPDYYEDELVDGSGNYNLSVPWCKLCRPRDYLAVFPDKEMMFAPGEKFFYNNGGFILLAQIVSEVSGKRYADFVEGEVLKPCGMESSGFYAFDNLPENTALGYIKDDGGLRTNIYDLPIIGGGDGGMYSTVGDINRFWECLLDYKILPKDLTEDFLMPHVKAKSESENHYYGYGVWIKKKPDGLLHYITGFDPGVSFDSQISRDKNIKVTVVSNTSHGAWPVVKLSHKLFES